MVNVIVWHAEDDYANTPFCKPKRHFFTWFRHIAIAFVTVSLSLNRGSHYELVHTCLTKRTTVWLGSYNRQRAFKFGSGFSIVNFECPLSIIWFKSNCGALRHSSVHLTRKRPPRFQNNMRMTKSIPMYRIEMKRCRFGVQNGVLHLFSLRIGICSAQIGRLHWCRQLGYHSDKGRLISTYTFSHCESAPSQLKAAWGNSFRQLHSNFDNLLALRQISLE